MSWIHEAFALIGALLVFVAGVGLLRMPDLYARMQATSKAGMSGISLLSIAAAVHIGDTGMTLRAVLIILFIVATAPIAAQAVARAAHRTGVPLAPEARVDELRERRGQHATRERDTGE